jgi:hypothetical protein
VGQARENGCRGIAIAEALDGKSVDWMEKVTDAQYGTWTPTAVPS